MMEKKKRLDAVFGGKLPDRPPVLGGWIAAPELLLKITGSTAKQYGENPRRVALDAYKKLEMDGLIAIFTTGSVDVYRCVDSNSYLKADKGISFEETVRQIEEMPNAGQYEKNFNFEASYAAYREDLIRTQAECGDMVYMPACWGAGARASWYGDFGYENFFLLFGLRPDLAAKLFEIGGAYGRCLSNMVAKAIREGLFPKALLLGEDICTQRGPMISVDFMREHYAPALAYGLEPLLEAGCRPVWHSDGDVRALIPMLLECGIAGFQGFQPECGMQIEDLIKLRTRDGEKMLIFGPLAVTTELPVLSPEKLRERVRYAADLCRDEADLVFMTSNTINPDVPYENLTAVYDEIQKYSYDKGGFDG
ncbi:MAG: hypothetical protein FWD23_02770 [Oscillospiraceae bacterium]|nr:hypothetical protein [Oscillospiraceae bacterium]